MSWLVPFIDAMALVAFVVAAVLLSRIPIRTEGLTSWIAKSCLVGAMAVYVFAMLSNVLEHSGVTAALDAAEDYLEVLFPALIVYGGYALHVRQRENELKSAQRAALRSQEMMLGILDAAPAGIIVLDDAGRITFANETAKEALDVSDDEGIVSTPGWGVRICGGPAAPDFAGLVTAEHGHLGVQVTVEWPNGWLVDFTMRTEELRDEHGRFGGMVATFLPQAGLHPESQQ